MKKIGDIINKTDIKGDTRNTYEFQAYGNRIAEELGDQAHRALYIKLAKSENRTDVENALEFVKRNERATTKGRLFMWRLGQIKKEKQELADKKATAELQKAL